MTSSTFSSTPVYGWRDRAGQVGYVLRRNPLVLIGVIVTAIWIVATIFAYQISPYEPTLQNINDRLQAPSQAHLWGTDELGRDIFSRVMHGGRITIIAGIAVIVFGSLLGSLVGAVSGFLGGNWDELMMRFTELFLAFPTIILAMAITAALGPDLRNAVLALVIVWWPSYARLMRGLVISTKTNQYVDAVESLGASRPYMLFQTIVPNCLSPMLVLTTLDIGNAILTFAGLSFLGLGAEPTTAEWGRMVAVGIDFFDQWWMWLFPGLAIATLVMALNFIGDGLRDVFDPRTRK